MVSTDVAIRPAPAAPVRRRAPIVRPRFALTFAVVVVGLALITWQVLTDGPLVGLDYTVHNAHPALRYPQFYDATLYLVIIGQRGPTAITAAVLAVALSWRLRSPRPVLLLGGGLLGLNGVVGLGKLLVGRGLPADNSAAVFVHDGIIFPSGHAANVVLTWGLAAYLLTRYGPLRRSEIGTVVTVAAALIVGVGSIYLDTHWVSDILAGWLAGAAVLMLTVTVDRWAPLGRHRRPPSRMPTDQRPASSSITGASSSRALSGAIR